jgi:hypothetical protein
MKRAGHGPGYARGGRLRRNIESIWLNLDHESGIKVPVFRNSADAHAITAWITNNSGNAGHVVRAIMHVSVDPQIRIQPEQIIAI